MNVKFQKQYKSLADNILERIEETRRDSKGGSVSFAAGLGFINYSDLLFSILYIPEGIPEKEVLARRQGQFSRPHGTEHLLAQGSWNMLIGN